MAVKDKLVNLEDLKVVGDAVGGLKSEVKDILSQSLDGVFASSGNQWFAFNFVAGKTYKFQNTSSGNYGMSVHTVNSSGSYDYVEQIGSGNIAQGGTATFIPTVDAPYLVVYCNGAGTFTVECVDTISSLENDIAKNTSDITTNAQTAAQGILANNTSIAEQFSHYGTKTYDSAGNNWFEFSLKAGHIYTIKNTGSTNITAMQSTNASGSYEYVDTIITNSLNAGAYIEFVPTNDAKYIHTYNAGAGSYLVTEETTVKKTYDSVVKSNALINKSIDGSASAALAISGNAKNIPYYPSWEKGGINTSTGADWDNAYSIRTKYIQFKSDATIIGTAISNNNSCTGYVYTSGEVFKQSYSITTNKAIKVSSGEYLRVDIYGNIDHPANIETPEDYIVLSIQNEMNDELPDYYKTYLNGKIGDIAEASAYIRGITFPFITDVHLQYNTMNSGKLIREIDKKTNAVPFVIFGGDVPKAIDTSANVIAYANQWNEYMSTWGKHKTIQVHGNHDYMCRVDGTTSNWFAPLSTVFEYVKTNNYNIVRPPMCLYGAIEIPQQSIAIVIADNYDASYDIPNNTWNGNTGMSNAQLKWIANYVLNTDATDILFVSHEGTVSGVGGQTTYEQLAAFDDLIKAIANKTAITIGGESFDFSSWQGSVIGELCGHTHLDSSAFDGGVLYVSVTCDCYVDSDPDVDRTLGTVSEQAFDIVNIDTINKTIKLVRIGGGSNRAWNYSTGEIIT